MLRMRITNQLDHRGYRPPWRLTMRPLASVLAAIAVWLWTTYSLTFPIDDVLAHQEF